MAKKRWSRALLNWLVVLPLLVCVAAPLVFIGWLVVGIVDPIRTLDEWVNRED